MLVPPPAPPPAPGDARRPLPELPLEGPLPAVDPLPKASRRQRVVVVLLTVAIGLLLWGALIYRPGWHLPDHRPCRPGQTTDCVGGLEEVLLLPPPEAAASVGATASSP